MNIYDSEGFNFYKNEIFAFQNKLDLILNFVSVRLPIKNLRSVFHILFVGKIEQLQNNKER